MYDCYTEMFAMIAVSYLDWLDSSDQDLVRLMGDEKLVKIWKKHTRFEVKEGKPGCPVEGGITEYFVNGVCHREDGPAVISDSREIWHYQGKIHRIDGPAIVDLDSGRVFFVLNGYLRCDQYICSYGPAIEYNEDQYECWRKMLEMVDREERTHRCWKKRRLHHLSNVRLTAISLPFAAVALAALTAYLLSGSDTSRIVSGISSIIGALIITPAIWHLWKQDRHICHANDRRICHEAICEGGIHQCLHAASRNNPV